MRAWLFLGVAIVAEVTGSLSLKAALQHPAWFALVAIGYLVSFVCLAQVLRAGMALGVAYGIWGALGVALTALAAAALFAEPLTPTMFAGMGLIILGVLTVELGSQRAKRQRPPRRLPAREVLP
ncbi:DMT family transporter [Leucobacter sp. M11]|uniref:DMT family transporter n=1 Tax=Leucobacter sp. M11 TaxID=2993565 RepID=UPI002D7F1379|nr:SMR family transporter [Leucobacter sp. M11]MEB4616488.1 SMR family transporter [Leucobacter sp. M11]